MGASRIAHSHHKPTSICIVCSINALADSYDFLFRIQAEIDDRYRDEYLSIANQESESWHVLTSSSSASMHFLLNKLMDDSPATFEAYSSISRNLIEKLSKLREVFVSEESALKSNNEFEATTYDVKVLFESLSPKNDSKVMKKEKFLDKGSDISNISEEKFQLIFTYLSRVIHSYNKDALLGDKMTRFIIKSYLMVTCCVLYHQTMLESNKVKTDIQNLHSITISAIEQFWSARNATQETLIYLTSFYEDTRNDKENNVLDDYGQYLDRALNLYSSKGVSIIPSFNLENTEPRSMFSNREEFEQD